MAVSQIGNGLSKEPCGDVFVTNPTSERGDVWPFVKPYTWLSITTYVIFTLRLNAWIV